ncbi:cellulase family glycosylhydrolase [Fluviicola sp.]|uniref:cellulase family glycosylhydrolase n=1 Tax=Fluviicola sp. TaxID=1917219 RepID=UPI003D2959B6
MKKQFTFLLIALISAFHATSQQNTLQVVGKNLTSINGQTIILRGVNYGLINQGDISLDDAAGYQDYIDEVANTGANAVRIPWYTDGQNWRDIPGPPSNGTPGTVDGYVTNGHLSNIIAYCISKKMIPILSIHDDSFITCKDNWPYFNSTVINFWTDPDVLALINTNKAHLIISLANEFDQVRWTASPATELVTFKTNYNTAIATMRQAGVNVPIMIDAPDCGQSSSELLSIAEEMNQTDTRHNLIFSSHAYWYGYASTLSQVQTKLNEAQNTNVCFILGEVATNQDGSNPGECGLNDLSALYPIILDEACSRNIGWLAWTFSLDCSPADKCRLPALRRI